MNYNEVLELRDKILAIAPEAVYKSLQCDKWATALACAETYFNLQEKDTEALKLWNELRSVDYISYALGKRPDTIRRDLMSQGAPVFKSKGHEVVNAEYVQSCIKHETPYRGDIAQAMYLTGGKYTPSLQTLSSVTDEERAIWHRMFDDGY